MTLQEYQREFLKSVITNDLDSSILKQIKNFEIYHNNFITGLTRALQNIYPVCQKLVGEEFFRAMAKKYIMQTPSYSYDIGNYGASLAEFIATFPPAKELFYLSDIARLEWIWYQVLQGVNNIRNDFRELTAIPEHLQNKIIFQLPKNCFLLTSKFPIRQIWEIHQENYQGEFVVDFQQQFEGLLIFKLDFVSQIVSLNKQEWQFLQKIKQQQPLENFSDEEINLLPAIVANGWVNGFIQPWKE